MKNYTKCICGVLMCIAWIFIFSTPGNAEWLIIRSATITGKSGGVSFRIERRTHDAVRFMLFLNRNVKPTGKISLKIDENDPLYVDISKAPKGRFGPGYIRWEHRPCSGLCDLLSDLYNGQELIIQHTDAQGVIHEYQFCLNGVSDALDEVMRPMILSSDGVWHND